MNFTIIIKSILYRLTSAVFTFMIALVLTGNATISLFVGSADALFKIFYYYYFDLLWSNIIKDRYKPCVVWMTGLSGSGKTTIAKSLAKDLEVLGVKSIILDGDEVRQAFPNIGFDKSSRIQHNINIGHMASVFEKQGTIVIISLISPFAEGRDRSREVCNKFIEVFVDTPLDICEQRDPKGLYKKVRSNEIKEFTGISSPYEIPKNPDLVLDTTKNNINQCVNQILNQIKK